MPEKCDKCGKEFDSERGLHIHQSQKHSEESTDNSTENKTDNQKAGITLTTKQFGGLTFGIGLLLGLLLGSIFLGGLTEEVITAGPELPDSDATGNNDSPSGTSLVELDSAEFPYKDLEAGVGEGERTFGNTTFKLDGEPYIGSSDAEVTAVSFEDFECPFCAQYNQNAYTQIVENYVQKGDVQYFYKNLPLPEIGHAWAEPSALASECALNQDSEAFWTFKQGFFNNQDALGNAYNSGNFDESMYRWAEQTGLDQDQFKTCYDGKEEMDEVRQDKQEAGNIGAQATPTIFINNEKVEGAQPYSRFEMTINSALQ